MAEVTKCPECGGDIVITINSRKQRVGKCKGGTANGGCGFFSFYPRNKADGKTENKKEEREESAPAEGGSAREEISTEPAIDSTVNPTSGARGSLILRGLRKIIES
ncbi:MAG: hypothetical protein P4K78_10695 [Terracidiphilus sp.]|nr:hypothetical protein [Terracidiphilus sp.]